MKKEEQIKVINWVFQFLHISLPPTWLSLIYDVIKLIQDKSDQADLKDLAQIKADHNWVEDKPSQINNRNYFFYKRGK